MSIPNLSTLVFAVMWVVSAAPGALHAQGCSHTTDDAEEERAELWNVFYGTRVVDAAARSSSIHLLAAADTNYTNQCRMEGWAGRHLRSDGHQVRALRR